MEAVGAHTFWGLSPAVDLLEMHQQAVPDATGGALDSKEPLNFLLVEAGDVRHVVKTLSAVGRRPGRPVHVYMYEAHVETLARSLLLLAVVLDWRLPIRTRAHTFLEIFGNTRVQDRTARYIHVLRETLVALVCERRGPLASLVDTTLLSHADIDDIEDCAKTMAYGAEFEVDELRDHRLRHHYADRYDFRTNLIDWDFHEHVHPNTGLIHTTLFRNWRLTGIGFEFGEETYTAPNRTLASYALGRERGRSTMRRGFWGDVVCSPFFALGTSAARPQDVASSPVATGVASGAAAASSIASPAAAAAAKTYDPQANFDKLFTINNRHSGSEQWRHHAVEIAVYNVVSWLHEMETGEGYEMRVAHDIYSGLGSLDESRDAGAEAPAEGSGAAMPLPLARQLERRQIALQAQAVRRARHIQKTLESIRVIPIKGDLSKWLSRSRLAGRMDGVLIGCRAVQTLEEVDVTRVLRPHAWIAVETARNIVVLKQHQKDEFERRMVSMAARRGLAFCGSNVQLLKAKERFDEGSVVDNRTAAQKAADRDAVAEGLRRQAALRPKLGDLADGMMYLRSCLNWQNNRGETPRPEMLVFSWDSSRCADRVAAFERLMEELRPIMLRTPKELEAEKGTESARTAAEATDDSSTPADTAAGAENAATLDVAASVLDDSPRMGVD